jgi:hypothetical protein
MRVCFTIDTEFSIAGAFADPALRPVGLPMVRCEVDGQPQGLAFLLAASGATACRPPSLSRRCSGTTSVMTRCGRRPRIAEDGHELQLHVHPCWAVFQHADWPQRVRLQPRQDDLAGASWLPRWFCCGDRPRLPNGDCRTAGVPRRSLQHDENLYRALAAAEFRSVPISAWRLQLRAGGYQLRAGRHQRHGVLECPVLTFADWPGHLKTVSVSGTSFAEMRWLLDCAHAAGWNWW